MILLTKVTKMNKKMGSKPIGPFITLLHPIAYFRLDSYNHVTSIALIAPKIPPAIAHTTSFKFVTNSFHCCRTFMYCIAEHGLGWANPEN